MSQVELLVIPSTDTPFGEDLRIDRLADDTVEITIGFYMEAHSVILNRAQEDQLKRVLRFAE